MSGSHGGWVSSQLRLLVTIHELHLLLVSLGIGGCIAINVGLPLIGHVGSGGQGLLTERTCMVFYVFMPTIDIGIVIFYLLIRHRACIMFQPLQIRWQFIGICTHCRNLLLCY